MGAEVVVPLLGLSGGLVGSVLVWLVRIEHRLTRMETTITERIPPRAAREG